MKKVYFKLFIYVLIWIIVEATVVLATDNTNYGYISAWWAVLWVSYINKSSLKVSVLAFIIGILYGVLSYCFKFDYYYHDIPSYFSIFFVLIIVIRAFLFALPIIINNLVFYIQNKINKKTDLTSRSSEHH